MMAVLSNIRLDSWTKRKQKRLPSIRWYVFLDDLTLRHTLRRDPFLVPRRALPRKRGPIRFCATGSLILRFAKPASDVLGIFAAELLLTTSLFVVKQSSQFCCAEPVPRYVLRYSGFARGVGITFLG